MFKITFIGFHQLLKTFKNFERRIKKKTIPSFRNGFYSISTLKDCFQNF